MTSQIANRIKPWRVARSLTQTQLAEKIGLSRQTVNSAEKGHSTLSLGHALRMARALSVTVEDIYSVDEFDGRPLPAKSNLFGSGPE